MKLQTQIVVFWLPDFVVKEEYALHKFRDPSHLVLDVLGKATYAIRHHFSKPRQTYEVQGGVPATLGGA